MFWTGGEGEGSDDKTSNIILQANFRLLRVGGANLTALLLCAFLTQSNIVLGIFLESSYRVQRRRRFPSFVHPF